jgi:hypothetical protein
MVSHGNVAALKKNVYVFGTKKNQADMYVKTTEALKDYVGVQCGKLHDVGPGNEWNPSHHPTPKQQWDKDISFELEKYKAEMTRYLRKKG